MDKPKNSRIGHPNFTIAALRYVTTSLVYLAIFFVLDWATSGLAVLPGNVLWFPPLGLSLALLIVFGLTYAPPYFLAIVISALWVHQLPLTGLGVPALATIIVGGYTGALLFLQRVLKIDLHLKHIRDLQWFILVTLATAFGIGALSVTLFNLQGLPGFTWDRYLPNVMTWWVGDVTGILSLTPLLVIALTRWQIYQRRLKIWLAAPSYWINAGLPFLSILLVIWMAFFYPPVLDLHLYYWSLLPLVWVAFKFGLIGASAGVFLTNAGMLLAANSNQARLADVLEIQLVMLVVSMAGLIVGAAVDYRQQIQRNLRQSEARWRSVMEHTPLKVTLVDRNGRILFINRTEPFRSPQAVLGTPIFDYLSAPEAARTRQELVQVFDQDRPTTYESRIQRTDGSLVHYENHLAPVRENGKVTAVAFISVNITSRKQAEHSLLESEARYRDLFENSPTSLWLVDCAELIDYLQAKRAAGVVDLRAYFKDNPQEMVHCARLMKILDLNQATLDLYQADCKEQMMGGLNRIMSPESIEASLDSFQALADQEQNFSTQTTNQTLNGEKIDIIMRWSLTPDHSGELTRMLMSVSDITQRVQAERDLQDSQRFIQAISDANPSYIYLFDIQAGRNMWVNKAWDTYFSQYTDQPASQVSEQDLLSLVHPDDQMLFDTRYRELQDQAELEWMEIEFRLQDRLGNWHWFQDRAAVFERTPEGEISKIIASMLEITDRKEAERLLQEKQRFIQATSDLNPSYMYIYDLQSGKNIWMNKAWHNYLSQIAGRDVEGIEEAELYALFHPDDIRLLEQRIQELQASPDLEWYEIELRLQDQHGDWHWFLDRATAFERTPQGAVSQILSSLIEVTELKQAEHALQESQHFVQAISDANPSYMFIFDFLQGRNTWVNRAWRDYFQQFSDTEAQTFEQELLMNLVHPDDLPVLVDRFQELRDRPNLEWNEAEFRLRDREDNWHWFQDRVSVFERTPDGELSQIIASMVEVTDRKEAERQLKESEDKFKVLFEASHDAQVISDAGLTLDCNQATLDLLGFSDKSQLINHTPKAFSPATQPDGRNSIEKAQEMVQLAYQDGVNRFDWLYQRADGSTLLMDTQMTVITLGDRSMLHVSARDISERVRLEAALRQYSEQLEEMVAARTAELQQAQEQLLRQERLAVLGQLGGGIAHELRTPLGAIKNMAYFLKMILKDPDEDIQEALEVLDKEVNTSAKIINSLLDYARPKPLMRTRVDLNAIVREALSRVELPDHVQVSDHLAPGLAYLQADPDKLMQVFLNLIHNAVQAMTDGGQLSLTSGTRAPDWQFVAIADSGVGIPAGDLQKVFQPLYTTKARGIGLGLALVKIMVEEHDGLMEVESQEGVGSTFTVVLPLQGDQNG